MAIDAQALRQGPPPPLAGGDALAAGRVYPRLRGAGRAAPNVESSNVGRLPRGVWALGLTSLLMDASSELIHALLPLFLTARWGSASPP